MHNTMHNTKKKLKSIFSRKFKRQEKKATGSNASSFNAISTSTAANDQQPALPRVLREYGAEADFKDFDRQPVESSAKRAFISQGGGIAVDPLKEHPNLSCLVPPPADTNGMTKAQVLARRVGMEVAPNEALDSLVARFDFSPKPDTAPTAPENAIHAGSSTSSFTPPAATSRRTPRSVNRHTTRKQKRQGFALAHISENNEGDSSIQSYDDTYDQSTQQPDGHRGTEPSSSRHYEREAQARYLKSISSDSRTAQEFPQQANSFHDERSETRTVRRSYRAAARSMDEGSDLDIRRSRGPTVSSLDSKPVKRPQIASVALMSNHATATNGTRTSSAKRTHKRSMAMDLSSSMPFNVARRVSLNRRKDRNTKQCEASRLSTGDEQGGSDSGHEIQGKGERRPSRHVTFLAEVLTDEQLQESGDEISELKTSFDKSIRGEIGTLGDRIAKLKTPSHPEDVEDVEEEVPVREKQDRDSYRMSSSMSTDFSYMGSQIHKRSSRYQSMYFSKPGQ